MKLLCGAAKRSIVPPEDVGPVRIAGYEAPNTSSPRGAPLVEGVHDAIHARAMIVSDGLTKIVLVSVDSVGLLGDFIYELKVPLEAWGFQSRNVFIFSTHTHAAPDTMGLWGPYLGISGENKRYRYFVMDAIIDAIKETSENMVPVNVYFWKGQRDDLIDNYRKPEDKDGSLVTLRFANDEDGTVALLWSYTAQPEISSRGNKIISGDYPGLISGWMERDHGGIALFGLGACGSQSPKPCEAGFDAMEVYANTLYEYISDSFSNHELLEINAIDVRERVISIPIENDGFRTLFALGIFNPAFLNGNNIITTVSKVKLGKVEMLHMPGEPFPGLIQQSTKYYFKDHPEHYLITISLSNDALGYLIPLQEFLHEAIKWKDEGNKTKFTGHEDESIGPKATTIIKSAIKDLFWTKTILAIGAHADDLSIWCGGTIKKFSDEGHRVICVRICDDWEDCVGIPRQEAIEINKKEAEDAYYSLGASEVVHLMYPSDYLAGEDYLALRGKIVRLIRKYKPDIVISFDLNGTDEENQDHIIVANAVNESCWQASFDALYPEHFDEGLSIHTVGMRYLFARNPTEVNFFVDISDYIGEKVNAICKHKVVMDNFFTQYEMLAKANKLQVDLLEKGHPNDVRVNLLVRMMYAEWGEKFGVKYAEPFNKVGAGMLEGFAGEK